MNNDELKEELGDISAMGQQEIEFASVITEHLVHSPNIHRKSNQNDNSVIQGTR